MTNSDIRLQTSWYSNLKRKKLQRRLGPAGPLAFVDLLIYVGVNKCDGDLSGLTDEDIETMAQWEGGSGVFVQALRDLIFIDGEPGDYRIHDWEENNPYAFHAPDRSEKAKNAARIRWECSEHATSMPVACGEHAHSNAKSDLSNAPSPSPSPTPKPKEENKNSLAPRPAGESKPTGNGEPKKPRIPIRLRQAKTHTSKIVRFWHRAYFDKHDTEYAGDIVKMSGQVTALLKKDIPGEKILAAMACFLDAPADQYTNVHNFDTLINKISKWIALADERGYEGEFEEEPCSVKTASADTSGSQLSLPQTSTVS